VEDLTGKQLGQYRILAPLGEGGMAAVYRAFQPGTERDVALKILPRHYASQPQFLQRFEQEARIIAKFQHPHILPVFDYGHEDGYTYIVMPFVEGGTLAEIMSGRPLPLWQVRSLVSQIGDALDYAHTYGVVHRDVKPTNILLDERGNGLLTDFGIAKMVEGTDQYTVTGQVIGTPPYMSPEQIQGLKLDGRSDIYSLGIVLYELATGRTPYRAETPQAHFFKHLYDPLPPPHTLNPDLPEVVEKVILKSLAKDPESRYQTAGEMAIAIKAAIQVDPAELQRTLSTDSGETAAVIDPVALALGNAVQGSDVTRDKARKESRGWFRRRNWMIVGATLIALVAVVVAILVINTLNGNSQADSGNTQGAVVIETELVGETTVEVTATASELPTAQPTSTIVAVTPTPSPVDEDVQSVESLATAQEDAQQGEAIAEVDGTSVDTASEAASIHCPETELDPQAPRDQPAVLFDESHGNGLSLTTEGAREIDSRPELYFYAGDVAEAIQAHGYRIMSFEKWPWTPAKLATYDLLVIPAPTDDIGRSFNTCEIEAAIDFVERGGGLLIFGDDGQGRQINQLLEPFGASMTGHGVQSPSGGSYPENFWLLDFREHPATGGVVRAWYNAGTTLGELNNNWSPLILSPEDVWLDEDPDGSKDDAEPVGPFVLGAAREYGRGRIVVYADNNVFDVRDPAYSMYLAMIDWAAGDPARSYSRAEVAGLALQRILFEDDFETGSPGDWNYLGAGFTVVEDESGNFVLRADGVDWGEANAGDTSWHDYALVFKVKILETTAEPDGPFVVGPVVRDNDNPNPPNCSGYNVVFRAAPGRGAAIGYEVPPETDCEPTTLDVVNTISLETDRWYTIRIEVVGQEITAYLDGRLVLHAVDDKELLTGGIALVNVPGVIKYIDEVRVTELIPLTPDDYLEKAIESAGENPEAQFAEGALERAIGVVPVYGDDFSDPLASSFQEVTDGDSRGRFDEGAYILEVDPERGSYLGTGREISSSHSDVIAQMDLRLDPYLSTLPGQARVFLRGSTLGAYEFVLEYGVLGLNSQFSVHRPEQQAIDFTITNHGYSAGTWHNLIVVAVGNEFAYFLDGSLVATFVHYGSPNGDFSLDASPGTALSIDNLRIWDLNK
jgi:serine/threonine protein kinase